MQKPTTDKSFYTLTASQHFQQSVKLFLFFHLLKEEHKKQQEDRGEIFSTEFRFSKQSTVLQTRAHWLRSAQQRNWCEMFNQSGCVNAERS